MNKLVAFAYRCGFVVAFVVAAVAVLEVIFREFGYTLLRRTYTAGRLLEFSAIVMIFVTAFLLRDIRQLLRDKRG